MLSRVNLAVVLVALAAGCSEPATEPAPTAKSKGGTVPAPTARATPWSVSYADGSGNGFRFWQDTADGAARFEYSPVTPALSSSGTYSGGDPQTGDLDAAQALELWQRFETLEADTAQHTTKRTMGSGTFRVTTPAGERSFMLDRGEALSDFDTFVEPFRGES